VAQAIALVLYYVVVAIVCFVVATLLCIVR
jgi:hypothetical protein